MANKPNLITGCQRSGTTLLSLIIDSHPDVIGIDEIEFDAARLEDHMHSAEYGPCVSFKLPVWSHAVDTFQHLEGLKILWVIRHPGNVVLSMTRLTLDFVGRPVLWANHPLGAEREIKACAVALTWRLKAGLLARYQTENTDMRVVRYESLIAVRGKNCRESSTTLDCLGATCC